MGGNDKILNDLKAIRRAELMAEMIARVDRARTENIDQLDDEPFTESDLESIANAETEDRDAAAWAAQQLEKKQREKEKQEADKRMTEEQRKKEEEEEKRREEERIREGRRLAKEVRIREGRRLAEEVRNRERRRREEEARIDELKRKEEEEKKRKQEEERIAELKRKEEEEKKRKQEEERKNAKKGKVSFQTQENMTFVQEQLGLTADNIHIIQDALTKAQATCEATDELRIKNAIDIVNKASNELGTPDKAPGLVASESESSSSDTASENDNG